MIARVSLLSGWDLCIASFPVAHMRPMLYRIGANGIENVSIAPLQTQEDTQGENEEGTARNLASRRV